jgi:hypothetical protein
MSGESATQSPDPGGGSVVNRIPLIDRVASSAERLIDRHIFGLQTDPNFWPPPSDCASIPVPVGINTSDDAGPAWILDNESLPAWHGRRTVIGAQAFRFECNEEYDCGWRLADVAARFLRLLCHGNDPGIITIVPPPTIYTPVPVLHWLGTRLAQSLDAGFVPGLFEAACPFHVHPDDIPHPKLTLSAMFRVNGDAGVNLQSQRVLLIDWRYHQGRTLTTLARLLRRSHAEVVRFAWLR